MIGLRLERWLIGLRLERRLGLIWLRLLRLLRLLWLLRLIWLWLIWLRLRLVSRELRIILIKEITSRTLRWRGS